MGELASDENLFSVLCGINVGLDFDFARTGEWRISFSEVETLDVLNGLFVPWYRAGTQFDVPLTHPGASPVTVGEAAQNLERWSDLTQLIVRRYEFALSTVPNLRIFLAAYPVGPSEFLILDGNHRAIALSLLQSKRKVTLTVINGPLDPAVLPDLRHFV